jgi:hypothetical protein
MVWLSSMKFERRELWEQGAVEKNHQILLANPKVPQICLAYAVIEGPGTWGIQSSNRSPVAWK